MRADHRFFGIESLQASQETEAFKGKRISISSRVKGFVSGFPKGTGLMKKMEPNVGNGTASLILLVWEEVKFKIFQLGAMPGFAKESKEDGSTA